MTALPQPGDYRAFLEAKIVAAPSDGIDAGPLELHPILKPHQRDMVLWAARGGRRALFASFGLGKTMVQLELMRLILARGAGDALIVLPLGVRQEFVRDAAKLGIALKFIRSAEEREPGIRLYLTNYESVRDGKLDPRLFVAASLDEASALRGFGGTKTFREFMRLFEAVRYRFVATATPSPNEFIELLAYAAFLGVMDVGQAKTRFFKRNSEEADALTLHPHKEREFWLWVASWGLFVQRPSDLGHSDEGYALPPLNVHWHELPTDHRGAGEDRDGQQRMFRNSAVGLSDAAREKRDTLHVRVAKLMEIVGDGRREAAAVSEGVLREEPRKLAGEAARAGQAQLPGEPGRLQRAGEALAREQPRSIPSPDETPRRAEPREDDRAEPQLVCAEQAQGSSASASQEAGTLRADGGAVLGASCEPGRNLRDLHVGEAEQAQPGELPRRSLPPDGEGPRPPLQSVQRRARPASRRSGAPHASSGLPDQVVIWCDLNAEQAAIQRALDAAGISFSSLYGNQEIEERERLLEQWRARATAVFLSKPSMYGAGVNLQQSHTMVFVGVSYKFADVFQGIHRIHRFLQEQPCDVHFIYTEAEREVRRALEDKWQRHREQAEIMAGIIREYGLAREAMQAALARSIGVARREAKGEAFTIVNNDCVDEARAMADASAQLIVTSIPFSHQYEYTPSYNDFGHTDDDAHFWRQMDFLTPELLRVLEPGRVAAIHVKDRIVPGGINGLGFQSVSPFSDQCVAHFMRHGFAYLARKTIVTDVVRENNQTYRLGWTEQCKDGSRMGCGMPEYVLLFRKPPTDRSNGYADVPVVKEKPLCDDHGTAAPFDSKRNWKRPVPGTGYSRARWQMDAHGFARSSGDRLISSDELAGLPHETLYKLWRDRSTHRVYDFAEHVRVAEALDQQQRLPATFMLFPPHAWHPDVWSDVARMRTLNGAQSAAGREMHLCPLQFDIVERLIVQLSMKGETVLDPFCGIGTVPYMAVKLGRRGVGIELNPGYFRDAVAYCEAIEREMVTPTLFDLLEAETPPNAGPVPPDFDAAAPIENLAEHFADCARMKVPAP